MANIIKQPNGEYWVVDKRGNILYKGKTYISCENFLIINDYETPGERQRKEVERKIIAKENYNNFGGVF